MSGFKDYYEKFLQDLAKKEVPQHPKFGVCSKDCVVLAYLEGKLSLKDAYNFYLNFDKLPWSKSA